jgi:polyhydroxyalkanoate synthesis repressor PhaR
MKKPKVVIRKYPDRRLYDTNSKRYVKVADIAGMIREGIDVEVLDARTKKDLTRVILTQIIIEDARHQETGLPMQFLRQLVMASDRKTHEFLSWYLNSTLELYHKAQQSLQSRLSDAKSVVSGPLEFVSNLLAGQQWPPAHEEGGTDELRGLVKELQERLTQRPKPARRAPARKRRA